MRIGTELVITGKLKKLKSRGRRGWTEFALKEAQTVYYLGYRTIYEGEVDWDDGFCIFMQTSNLRVFLVVANERTNPFYILESQIQARIE